MIAVRDGLTGCRFCVSLSSLPLRWPNTQALTDLHPLIAITAIALFLGTVEGVAYWWMSPTSAGQGKPVLVYRPGTGSQESGDSGQENANTRSFSPGKKSAIDGLQSSSTTSTSATITPLPEIYAKSAPMLRCSGGQVMHARLDESSGIHLAFFEWDGTDTGSVLEAFRHMPEACMGSIGLKLVSREKPISYTIGSETLLFDHTVFREGGGHAGLGPPIHAFRAVWVSGVSAADARKGLGGDEFNRLRTIRLKSATDRFRPAHARVIQGAVRGIADPDLAWQAFESAMLKDLSFQ